MDFFQYIKEQGVDDPEMVMVFVEEFLENPEIFFQLTESERSTMENKIDGILDFFRD